MATALLHPDAEEAVAAQSASNSVLRLLAWTLLASSLIVVLYVRTRLLDMPLERDEGEYAYAGQLMLDGFPPYQLAYNMKLPGIYLAYAAIMAVFGQTPAGIHLGLLVVHVVTLVVFFLLARRLFSLSGAAVATAAFAFLALSPSVYGLSGHATHFVVLPALIAFWFLFRYQDSGQWRDCLISGLSFGIAFLMKQPGIFFGVFGGLYLIWICLRSPHRARRRYSACVRTLAAYVAGCALPLLGVCAWLWSAGVFPQFWFWTVSYARAYGGIVPLAEGWVNLRDGSLYIFLSNIALCSAAVLGLALLLAGKMEWEKRVFLSGFLAASFLAVCPGLYFRPHYFISLLPAIAMLVAVAVEWAEKWFAPTPWLRILPLAVGLVGCGAALLPFFNIFFLLSPQDAFRSVHGRKELPESLSIASYIQQNSNPQDRIAVIGSEPEIYFYSHRLASTGYIYMYPLMEPQPFAERMRQEMIREINRNPPSYLVFVCVPGSLWSVHYWENDSRRNLVDWVDSYVQKNMQRVGLIQLTGPQTSVAVWGPEAASAKSVSPETISIYKRIQP